MSVLATSKLALQFLRERFASPIRFLEPGVVVLAALHRDLDLLNHPLRNIHLRHEGPSRECPIPWLDAFSHNHILAHNVRIFNF